MPAHEPCTTQETGSRIARREMAAGILQWPSLEVWCDVLQAVERPGAVGWRFGGSEATGSRHFTGRRAVERRKRPRWMSVDRAGSWRRRFRTAGINVGDGRVRRRCSPRLSVVWRLGAAGGRLCPHLLLLRGPTSPKRRGSVATFSTCRAARRCGPLRALSRAKPASRFGWTLSTSGCWSTTC